MKDYLKLLRVKHYIKNILVFIPLFFARELFDYKKFFVALEAFICFCLISSAIYIINDLRDIEKDRAHSTKCYRPLASGRVSEKAAIMLFAVCFLISILCALLMRNAYALFLLLTYFILNLGYSFGLKNKPIIDVVILASGFVIRILYGGVATDVFVSKWLYLVVAVGALYMGFGKRRNELKEQKETRDVLQYYNVEFLDKNMYVCMTLTNVFFALWTVELSNQYIVWTVPLFIIIMMRYSLDVEKKSDGDPTEVILHDKILVIMVSVYAVCIFLMLYLIQ